MLIVIVRKRIKSCKNREKYRQMQHKYRINSFKTTERLNCFKKNKKDLQFFFAVFFWKFYFLKLKIEVTAFDRNTEEKQAKKIKIEKTS